MSIFRNKLFPGASIRNLTRARRIPYKDIHRLVVAYPALTIVSSSLILTMLFSYVFYAGKVMGFGDAIKYIDSGYASSLLQYIYYDLSGIDYSPLIGLTVGLAQRVSYYFAYGAPLKYQWWFTVGMMQTGLFVSPILIAFFFKRVFQLSALGAFLVFLLIFSAWSLNPVLIAYSLNFGNGPYPIAVFLFSTMLLVSVNKRSRAQFWGSYILYALVLNFIDMLKVPALIFFLAVELLFHTESLRRVKEYRNKVGVIFLLFFVGSFASFFAPGFQRRLGAFQRLGVSVEGFSEKFERIPVLFSSTIDNTYPYLFSRLNEHFEPNYSLLHFFLVFSAVSALGYAVYRHFFRQPLSRRDMAGVWIFVCCFAALHTSFVRVFVSIYHGAYANSAPTFLLAMSLAAFGIFLVRHCPWEGAPKVQLMLGACIALTVFVLIPNLQDSGWQVRLMKAKFRSMVSAYRQVLQLSGKNSKISGASPPARLKIQLTEIPVYGEFNHNRYYGDFTSMLRWQGITNVELTSPWRRDFDPKFPGPTIRVVSFPAIPRESIFRRYRKPQHVLTVVSYGKAEFDFWIPSSVKRGCTVYVNLNPNAAATPQYRSWYKHEMAFVTGWSGRIASLVKLTPVLSAESMPPVGGYSLSATWLLNGRPAAGYPINPGKGKTRLPRVVRYTVKGGHPKFSHANAQIELANCR